MAQQEETSDAISNAEKVERLRWGLSGDFANIVHFYFTFAPTILILFLDSLGFSKSRIAVLLATVTFVDLLALFSTPVAARVGFRRVFVGFWVARKTVLLGMIAAPWVLHRYGVGEAFAYCALIILAFSVCRTIAVSALSAWSQEYIPSNIRGKFAAVQNIVVVVSGILATAAVGWFLGKSPAVERFCYVFAAAYVFGLAGAFFYSRLPGGKPEPPGARKLAGLDAVRHAARDRNLWIFELGSGLVILGWGAMANFLALFMKEHAGLQSDQLFYLDSTQLSAGLLSCFLWGWAADRFGGKPVMLLNLGLMILYPIGLLFIGSRLVPSYPLALGLAGGVGLLLPGWSIGYSRYFYVNLSPEKNRTGYIALHTAVVGVLSGIAPILAAEALKLTANFHETFGPLVINPYTPLFLGAVVGLTGAVAAMSRLPASGGMEVSAFAGMFLQGNPVAAMQAIIAHEMSGGETARVATIEKLGQARSPLSVDELIEGLRDPSFNVRYEAVISIARTMPHPRLTEALIEVVGGDEPDLAITAVWALGRIGDKSAIPALRNALESPLTLLRTRAARALAMLGDAGASARLLHLFRTEREPTIRLAYASALGSLNRPEALPSLLEFLRTLESQRMRLEVALAIATILGEDDRAVKLWRRMNTDPGDALAGVVIGLRRKVPRLVPGSNEHQRTAETLGRVVDRCARAFAAGDMTRGAAELRILAAAAEPAALTAHASVVLWDAIDAIDEYGAERMEYVTLAVHTLHVGIDEGQARPASGFFPRLVGGDS